MPDSDATDARDGAASRDTQPSPPAPMPSRRTFLIGGSAALAVGVGAGAATEFRHEPSGAPATPRATPAPAPAPPTPTVLLAALAAERELIAALDTALAAATPAASRVALTGIRSDHLAHERALALAVSHTVSSRPSGTSSTVATAAQLRRAESGASRRAATRAATLSGAPAVLLASIAASEASHAELLT